MKTVIRIKDKSPNITPEASLQPLREVGSHEKSQHWHQDDIMAALRTARLQGIPLHKLFANTQLPKR
jgi:hypothetical protein